jgi:hypothetical protein
MMKRCWVKVVEVYDSRRLVKVGAYVLLLVIIGVSAKSFLGMAEHWMGAVFFGSPILSVVSRLAARDFARSRVRKYKAARTLQRLLEGCAAVTSLLAATLFIYTLIVLGALLPWVWWCIALLPLALCAILEAMVWTSRRAEGSGVKGGGEGGGGPRAQRKNGNHHCEPGCIVDVALYSRTTHLPRYQRVVHERATL